MLAAALATTACGQSSDAQGSRPFLYVGSEGDITWYSAGGDTGSLEKKGSMSFGFTAAFLARSSDNKHLYALLRTVNEMKRQMEEKLPLEGFVASFTINQTTGALREIGRISSGGDRPTYITIEKNGKFALVANNLGHLVGHSVTVFPIEADGTLAEPVQAITTGTRAHQIRVHPSNKWVYVPNIDSDTVSQFRFDEKTGKLTPLSPPEVTVDAKLGPRHLDFHPNGKWVYLSNEYGAVVVTFSINDDGTLKALGAPVSGVPADYSTDPMDKWQSEIRVHPSGRFVYAGERARTPMVADQSVAVFAVDEKTGALRLKQNVPTMGRTPRNLVLDPAGKWLVVGNQESNSLVTFRIDPDKGTLTKAFGPMEQPTPYVHLYVMLP
jgi:6-phosphogluconolactonase